MTSIEEVFARYLRQRSELGEVELVVSAETCDALRRGTVAAPPPAAPGEIKVAEPVVSTSRPPAESPPPTVGLDSVGSLDAVGARAAGCTACQLCETRSTVVFGEGNPRARLMVVGEAPGAEEDRTGRPFVGRAGRLLDSLLMSVGFSRESVYICNVLKCRPPQNRDPRPEEVDACAPFLARQLEIVAPEAILAVGAFPARSLLETSESIGRLRGSVHEMNGIPVIPTYHPAALLRNPALIRPVWEDLQRLRGRLDG